MSLRLKKSALLAAAVASLCAMPMVSSADAGDWILRAGASMVDPDEPNLKLGPGTNLVVDEDTQFTFDITYMLSKHFGLELLAAAPFNHGLFVQQQGAGKSGFGEVEHLPPTLSLQWHMNPDGAFRPYVGVGGNYTMFSGEKPKGLNLDDSWGYAVGAGVDIGQKYRGWFLNLAAKYIQIEPEARLNGAKLGDVEINPMVYSVNVGYLFGTEPAPPAPEPEAAPPPPPPPPPPPAPADSDGDGVTDDLDKCPGTPAGTAVDSVGCPMIQTLQLLFDFDSAELRPESITELERVVKFMGDVPFATALVEGHTDSIGTEEYNLALSDRRAKAVFDYLSSRGVDPARLKSVGKGEAEPIADNKTAEGRQQNRRVMLIRTDSK